MSDVAAIQELVQRQKALKQEIAKVIVGQDEVVHQIVMSIFPEVTLYLLVCLVWPKH